MEVEVSKVQRVTGQGVAVFWKVRKLLKEERVSQLGLAVRWRAVQRVKVECLLCQSQCGVNEFK